MLAKLDPYTSVTIYPADRKRPIRVHGELERGGKDVEIRMDKADAERLVYALQNALKFHKTSV